MKLIRGDKKTPKIATQRFVQCECGSTHFHRVVVGLVRDEHGNVTCPSGAYKYWACAQCGKPVKE